MILSLYLANKREEKFCLIYALSMNSGSTHLLSSVEKPTLYFLGTSLITVVGKVGTSLDSLLRNWNVLIGTRLLIGDSSIGGWSREQDKTQFYFHKF